jgi:hypothetical protein
MAEESHITIKSDNPVTITSTALGANVNALVFNIDLIVRKNPNLAIEIMKLYEQGKVINVDDPAKPEEDFALALEQLSNLFK